MESIEILVSCHKPSETVKSDIIKTIQVGAETNAKFAADYADNLGDNISLKNPEYCELTAQYWAWKNLDADYYGFFHYRRYLAFANTDKPQDSWGNILEDYFSAQAVETYGLHDDTIRRTVCSYDIILPELKDITKMPHMGRNMVEQYLGSGYLHRQDWDIMMDVLSEFYPEYLPYAKQYAKGHTTYFNNMFIMRKDIFQTYAAWLFDVLDKCYARMDMSDYSVEALRTPGHLGERLLNIYCAHLKSTTNYRFCELPTLVFLNTDPVPCLKPAFAQNNVAIALSANDYYVPYVSALLLSMKTHFSSSRNYDILIMTRDISPISQGHLSDIFERCENVSVRFINVSRFSKQFDNLFLRGHFALETYFRLLMPELMAGYKKVLYLDCDIIVNADLADLYDTDVDGYLLAAAHDADTAGLYNGFEPNKKNYMDNVLKIKKPYEYFQAGVILFNLEMFRSTYSSEEMLTFAASNKWELLDQDVLNYLAQGRYKAVDMAWNVMTDWRRIRIQDIISRAPKYLRDEYMKAHANPKVIHYAGPDKPWQQPSADYAEYFWKYARQTIYYEVLMQRLCAQTVREFAPGSWEFRAKRKLKDIVWRVGNCLFPQYTRRREFIKKLLGRA